MKLKLSFLLVSFLVPVLASLDAGAGEWFLFRSRPRVVVRQYRMVVPQHPAVEAVPEPAAEASAAEPLVLEEVEVVRVLKIGPLLLIDDVDDDD